MTNKDAVIRHAAANTPYSIYSHPIDSYGPSSGSVKPHCLRGLRLAHTPPPGLLCIGNRIAPRDINTQGHSTAPDNPMRSVHAPRKLPWGKGSDNTYAGTKSTRDEGGVLKRDSGFARPEPLEPISANLVWTLPLQSVTRRNPHNPFLLNKMLSDGHFTPDSASSTAEFSQPQKERTKTTIQSHKMAAKVEALGYLAPGPCVRCTYTNKSHLCFQDPTRPNTACSRCKKLKEGCSFTKRKAIPRSPRLPASSHNITMFTKGEKHDVSSSPQEPSSQEAWPNIRFTPINKNWLGINRDIQRKENRRAKREIQKRIVERTSIGLQPGLGPQYQFIWGLFWTVVRQRMSNIKA
ncbi:hypothetical protein SODALDRAFT_354686 [Sodiomyces alkalinus F11]|uniref:Zn(2)-C6 fungal-type domain-containing protein n=1 Tax=Sodiomyces alkalinus (strain CBS 110278 / VKM F-3762 / F11) TaxID=1314773 RepID=A0A3N2Q6W0_SODAK|nr:hypothetical protein SODALDRAFT_354686 [Sodiomyces alkalinus F11]ROT42529.1 hypothetical protein SODALDRAFT_354686 [Sodiomyces alkalinus F11]